MINIVEPLPSLRAHHWQQPDHEQKRSIAKQLEQGIWSRRWNALVPLPYADSGTR